MWSTRYQDHKKKIAEVEKSIKEFVDNQSLELAEILAAKAARYMLATRRLTGHQPENLSEVAKAEALDQETLERWVKYLTTSLREHPFLKEWDRLSKDGSNPEQFQAVARKLPGTASGGYSREKRNRSEKPDHYWRGER